MCNNLSRVVMYLLRVRKRHQCLPSALIVYLFPSVWCCGAGETIWWAQTRKAKGRVVFGGFASLPHTGATSLGSCENIGYSFAVGDGRRGEAELCRRPRRARCGLCDTQHAAMLRPYMRWWSSWPTGCRRLLNIWGYEPPVAHFDCGAC